VVERNTYTGAKWFNLKNRNSFSQLVNATRLNQNEDGIIFDGVNDYIFDTTNYNIKTVIAVAKFKTPGSYIIVGPFENGSDNWFGFSSTRKIEFFGTQSSDVNNFSLLGLTTLEPDKFYHIACTIGTNTVKLYLNGVEDRSTTTVFTIGAWNGRIDIGRRGNIAQRYLNGELSYLKLYDEVLTEQEIKQNFEAFRGRYGL
jgi:hypothetical protein